MLTRIGGVLLVILTQQPATAPAAGAEFDKRLAKAARALVPDHLALAKKCREWKLDKQAAKEWSQVLALDPENAEARAGLGYKRVDGVWVEPKGETPFDGSREKLEEVWPRRNAIAKKAVKELTPVVDYGVSAGLEKRARELARLIVEYDINAAGARKALGQVMTDDGWTSKADVEDAQRLAKRIASAPVPKPAAGPSPFEAKLGVKLLKLETPRVRVEGTLNDSESRDVAQRAEAAWTELTEFTGLAAPKDLTTVTFLLFAGKGEFEKAVDGFSKYRQEQYIAVAKSASMAWLSTGPGAILGPRQPSILYRDSAVHYVVHHLVEGWCAPAEAPAWLREGAAFWTSSRIAKSTSTYCSAFHGTNEDARSAAQRDWRATARAWAMDGGGPTARQAMESGLKELDMERIVKSRTLFDAFVRSRPEDLREYIRRIAAKESPEAAAREAFHVKDYEELDARWRDYVKDHY
jgi:hypothetical protein